MNVFSRDAFISAADGSTKAYEHVPEMFPLLGSAKLVKLQWIGHRASKSTAEVTSRAYESSYPVRRPSEVGSEITLAGNVFTALRPSPITAPASFMGLLEIVVEVRDSDANPAEVQVEGELWATLNLRGVAATRSGRRAPAGGGGCHPSGPAPGSAPWSTGVLAAALASGCGPAAPAGETAAPTSGEDREEELEPGVWAMVSAGEEFTCGIRLDGSLACWGINGIKDPSDPDNGDWGQVSDAPTDGTWSYVDGGVVQACAVRAQDGSIACWGSTDEGEAAAPRPGWAKVATTIATTCAIDAAGHVACWGNAGWRLDECHDPPLDERTYLDVDVSFHNVLLLHEDGSVEVRCASEDEGRPPEGPTYVAIAGGAFRSCALTEEGTAICWGALVEGGVEEHVPRRGRYRTISSAPGFRDIACATLSTGGMDCWGSDLGVLPEELLDVTEPHLVRLSVGGGHVCAVTDNHDVLCWGNDYYGQVTPPARRAPPG